MILHVDDLEYVPDGRFLERASIEANSTVLTDLDGVLRPSNVDKNTAILGAKDLPAKITRLIARRELRNASIGAESNVLIGILFDPAEKQARMKSLSCKISISRAKTVRWKNFGSKKRATARMRAGQQNRKISKP